MIHLDRPFSVGDWVRSPDRNIEGIVEKIGWRLAVMRTFDNRPLYVPNALFTQIVVENPSRMTNRRIVETVGIRYDDAGQMAGIVVDVKAMLEAHPEIDTDQTLIMNFNEFSPSSRDFCIHVHENDQLGAVSRNQAGRPVENYRDHRGAWCQVRVPDLNDPSLRAGWPRDIDVGGLTMASVNDST